MANEKRLAQEELKNYPSRLKWEPESEALTHEQLIELQYIIEMMIFCAVYNFEPIPTMKLRRHSRDYLEYETLKIIPLPGGLWSRLTQRYSGMLLPHEKIVANTHGAALALSLAFSKRLYPAIRSENNDAIRRFKALRPGRARR